MAVNRLLEICVDTTAGLRAAVDNGADRIELCAALSEGGLTPSHGFMKLAAACPVPVRAIIRPRAGDFTYTPDELAVMHDDIDEAARAGLTGVVIGANRVDGALDETVLAQLCQHAQARGLDMALHRGFDLTPDPMAALETAIGLGFSTILTSGGALSAPLGIATLRTLAAEAGSRIEILAGGGVTSDNVPGLLAAGIRAVHASCRAGLSVRNERAMELGYVLPSQRDTDGALVRRLRERLNAYKQEAA